MADYVLSRFADRDLDSIGEYTRVNFGKTQTDKYLISLHQAAAIAANFPVAGKSYTTRQGRTFQQYNCGRHSIFYLKEDDGIFVVRILHQMMDFDRHLDRDWGR